MQIITENIVYACCDSVYFLKFGEAFINSAVQSGHRVHVHVLNSSNIAMVHGVDLTMRWGANKVKITREDVPVPHDENKKRTIYACYRFHDVVKHLDDHVGYLILDIDCVVRSEIPFPETSVALYFRDNPGTDWESMGMRIAAGAVYYGPGSKYFAQCVSSKIEAYPPEWFVDQRALYEVAEQFKYAMNITDLSKIDNFLDWEFKEDGIIWTGKGPRKYNNATYVKEVEKFKNSTGG